MKDNTWMVLVIVFILVILALSFFGGTRYVKYKEAKEIHQANLILNGTARYITETGNVPLILNNTLIWRSLQDICGG